MPKNQLQTKLERIITLATKNSEKTTNPAFVKQAREDADLARATLTKLWEVEGFIGRAAVRQEQLQDKIKDEIAFNRKARKGK